MSHDIVCPILGNFATDELAAAAESITSPITAFVKNLYLDQICSQNDAKAWLTLLVGTVVGVVAGWIVSRILGLIAKRCMAREWRGQAQLLLAMMGPANLAIVALGFGVGFAALKTHVNLHSFVKSCMQLIGAIVVLWYAYNLVDFLEIVIRRLSRNGEGRLNHLVVLLMSRSLRVFLVVVGTLYVAKSVFNQDIGAWLAGLGIAGLAVSLAAQDSLKNLFGSVTIVLDHSFHIGDRIISGGFDGTVEDIGFRSTKLRTTGGHLVTIPNSNLVNGVIENVSRRPAQRRVVTLLIPGTTPYEKLCQLSQALTGLFGEEAIRGPICPRVHGMERPPLVRFEEIREDGFRLNITYWYAPANDPKFAAHAEAVNLRIVEILQTVGVALTK